MDAHIPMANTDQLGGRGVEVVSAIEGASTP